MQKKIIIPWIIAMMPVLSFAQWTDISVPSNTPITHAAFIDDLRGYVASSTEIWRTTDGGMSWDSTTFIGTVIDVDFSSTMDGCVLIQGSGYYRIKLTNDGGDTWNYLDWWGGPFDSYYGLISTNSDSYFISSYNWIIKTHDGGLQWDTLSFAGYPMSMDKEKIDADTILFTGWDGTFMYEGQVTRSYDGGNTWNFINTGDNYTNFDGSYFINGKHGYAVYHRGWAPDTAVIAYTSDGGDSWNEIHYDTSIVYHDVFMKNSLEGFVLATENGNGKILSTIDGNNFTEEFSSADLLNRLYHAENTLYAVGNNGLVLKKNAPLGILNSEISDIEIYPNPAIDYIFLNNQNVVDIVLRNTEGKVVLQKNLQTNEKLELKNISPGIYFLSMQNGGKSYNSKLVITR